MIDIIIPIYNGRKTIRRALNSIVRQNMIRDIDVYLIDDGSSEEYKDIIIEYGNRLNLKYEKLKQNGGPGNARNYGLQISNGDYVVFIDGDDQLASVNSIKTLYEAIQSNKSDIARSSIYENGLFGNRIIKNWNISLHGKMYRRAFIKKNNISFLDSYSNEDMAFNMMLKVCGAKISDIDNVTYIWNYNKDSIYRKNQNENRIKDFCDITNNTLIVLNESIKRNCDKKIIELVALEQLIQIFIRWLYIQKSYIKSETIDSIRNICDIYLKYNITKIEELICENELMTNYNESEMNKFYNFLNEVRPNFTKEMIK